MEATSVARPGYHPDPGDFDFATYATLDLTTRHIAIHSFRKPCVGTPPAGGAGG